MADLGADDIDMAKLVFDIYDEKRDGKIDGSQLGSALRCLKLNPTEAGVKKVGGTEGKGEKQLSLEEFLPIVSQVKQTKEVGSMHDFVEALKMYDKQENGTMMSGELFHLLTSLGERLKDADAEEAMKFIGEEDEDGFFKYEPWLKILLAGGPEEFAKHQAKA